jgi:hypothetical protein
MSDAFLSGVAHVAGETPSAFGDRVFRAAQRAAIVDPITFARRAFAAAQAESASLRSVETGILAKLHAHVAEDSFLSGWVREARIHARRAVALQPWRVVRPRMWTLLSDRERELDGHHNRLLAAEAIRLARAFQTHRIQSRLVGTLAVSLHTDRFVKLHDDIDFVMPSATDLDAAVSLLTAQMGYTVSLAYDWVPPGADPAGLRKLDHPSGLRVDLAHLPHWPVRAGAAKQVDGVTLPIVDFRDLRNTYAVFLVMNEPETTSAKRQSDRHTILTLDRILGRPPTVAVLASDCDRLPAGFPDSDPGREAARQAT